MSFNKKQLGKDSQFAKKPVVIPKPVIPVLKKGGMTKGGKKC
jgi:hypothetical protein